MNGITQLLKGIAIGIVLLLAIIGLLNIVGNNSENDNAQITSQPTQPDIIAPSISIQTPADDTAELQSENDLSTPLITDSNENQSNAEALTPTETETGTDTLKPEIVDEPVIYGEINLSAKYIGNNDPSNVDFIILDSNRQRVAESKNVSNATFRLPVGEYKAVAMLDNKVNTQEVKITEEDIASANFEIQPPISTGILQVSSTADVNNQPLKTNFSIQSMEGEIMGNRQQVTSTLFKLEAGNYKITATSGGYSEVRTVSVVAGESIKESFRLKATQSQGQIMVRAVDELSSEPVAVDFIISTPDGKNVKQINAAPRAEFSLPAGNYQIKAIGPNGQTVRNIELTASQQISEVFIFKKSHSDENTIFSETPNNPIEAQTNPIEPQVTSPLDTPPPLETDIGILQISAINALDQKNVKSNFYVQLPNGKNIDKKIYVDSARFELSNGTYKITVKSTGMKTISKLITVDSGSRLNQIFNLQSTSSTDVQSQPPTASQQATPKIAPETGTLVVTMQGGNRSTSRNRLISTFTITTKSGKTVAEINNVQNATIKLDVGEYVVTASHKNRTQTRTVIIRRHQATRLDFNENDFQASLGILRTRVIDINGNPLKGDISVINKRGRVIRNAQNTSVAEFQLPAKSFSVTVNYRGLIGNELVNIIPGETTLQTFTITP